MAQLVGHPDGEEPTDVIVGRVGQEGLDAQPGDLGLDALGVAQRVPEPRGEDVRTADPLDRPVDRLDVERRLRLHGADPSFERLVALTDECRTSMEGELSHGTSLATSAVTSPAPCRARACSIPLDRRDQPLDGREAATRSNTSA